MFAPVFADSGKWVVIQALIVVTLVAVIGSYLITPSYEASSNRTG